VLAVVLALASAIGYGASDFAAGLAARDASVIAVTAVLTSLYPAVTIVLARTVLGERLTALRVAGLGLAGVCVSLIAVGGAS
jgi:drug/metabolite transporter (DMT)-like permease